MEKKYSPVLPFDCTVNDSFVVYNNVKYQCNIEKYQTEDPIRLHHNNMVKYYDCKYEDKPMKLGGG